jgi:HK97 gp10 family phage protein
MAKPWEVDDRALAQLMLDPGIGKYLEEAAEVALEMARSLAPVRTGEYRDSLVVERAHIENGELVVGFGSTSSHWHFVEFGSAKNSPYAVLRTAADAVVDRLDLS